MEYLAELLKKKLSEQTDEEINRKWDKLDSEYDIIPDKVMTNEEKELVIKDLCARSIYGVKTTEGHGILKLSPRTDVIYVVDNGHIPYLRPLSSMTKEELKEFYIIEGLGEHPVVWNKPQYNWHFTVNGIDWLNAHHFDYRGLIGKGLALEAPAGMYD